MFPLTIVPNMPRPKGRPKKNILYAPKSLISFKTKFFKTIPPNKTFYSYKLKLIFL